MSRHIADFSGNAVYLDTMIPYALLRGIDPEAKFVFERIRKGEMKAYTSVLTFDELAYRLLLALIKDRYGGSPLEKLRHEEKEMIRRFYPTIAPRILRLHRFPNLSVLDIAAADVQVMSENILQYHVKPRDALHITAMQKCKCFNLLSHDEDFDRVPDVQRYTMEYTPE
jgi:predicted nucleic acid-binding protein